MNWAKSQMIRIFGRNSAPPRHFRTKMDGVCEGTSSTMAARSCRTTSCSTTSTPTISNNLGMTEAAFINISGGDCEHEAGRGTSTIAGDATTNRSGQQRSTPTLSQMRSKRGMESVYSSDSSTSVTSSSSKSANKKKKKKKKLKTNKAPTENHLKLRAAVDAVDEWEADLEKKHGLSEEDACVCVSKIAPYVKKSTFPSPTNGDRLMELAKEGWKLMNELHRLIELHPECGDQTKINGEWIML